MKYVLALTYFLVFVLSINNKIYCQYDLDRIDNYNDSIKTMAIMPYKLHVGRNGGSSDTTATLEKDATIRKAYYLQEKLYEWLTSKQKYCKIIFQDVYKTDSLLRRTKLSFDDLLQLNEGALCKYLDVDGITYCEIRMSNPNFEIGNEIRKDVLVGVVSGLVGNTVVKKANKNKTIYRMSIYDKSGNEIWKYTTINDDWANNSSDNLSQKFIGEFNYKLPFIRY